MPGYSRSFGDLAATFHRLNQADLFGRARDPEVEAARQRFHSRRARQRRREAILPFIEAPWTAWAGTTAAARIARRFLLRFPERDRPDPAHDLLTDRQAAVRYHIEEAENEERYGGCWEW
jgi:hypothetical protein